MTAGRAASRCVLARSPVGINRRTSAPPKTSLPDLVVCMHQTVPGPAEQYQYVTHGTLSALIPLGFTLRLGVCAVGDPPDEIGGRLRTLTHRVGSTSPAGGRAGFSVADDTNRKKPAPTSRTAPSGRDSR